MVFDHEGNWQDRDIPKGRPYLRVPDDVSLRLNMTTETRDTDLETEMDFNRRFTEHRLMGKRPKKPRPKK